MEVAAPPKSNPFLRKCLFYPAKLHKPRTTPGEKEKKRERKAVNSGCYVPSAMV
jgi:hypothetical protein